MFDPGKTIGQRYGNRHILTNRTTSEEENHLMPRYRRRRLHRAGGRRRRDDDRLNGRGVVEILSVFERPPLGVSDRVGQAGQYHGVPPRYLDYSRLCRNHDRSILRRDHDGPVFGWNDDEIVHDVLRP